MILRVCVIAAYLAASGVGLTDARSAEFKIVSSTAPTTNRFSGAPILTGRNARSPCHIRLEGTIKNGDLKRLQQALARIGHDKWLPWPPIGLCLDSRGGSYMAAIRIAKAMLGKSDNSSAPRPNWGSIWTVVAEEDECYSACAVIFMAGNILEDLHLGPTINRYLHVRGQLGFHSPYLAFTEKADVNFSGETVKKAFRQGTLAVRELTRLGQGGHGKPEPKRFPTDLINEMVSRDAKNLYFIDTVLKAAKYEIALYGGSKPSRVGPCEYDNICLHAGYPGNTNCSKGWKVIRNKYLFSGDDDSNAGGYGSEALYHCVLKMTGKNLKYYSELVDSTRSKLDEHNFLEVPWWYYYAPSTRIASLGDG